MAHKWEGCVYLQRGGTDPIYAYKIKSTTPRKLWGSLVGTGFKSEQEAKAAFDETCKLLRHKVKYLGIGGC